MYKEIQITQIQGANTPQAGAHAKGMLGRGLPVPRWGHSSAPSHFLFLKCLNLKKKGRGGIRELTLFSAGPGEPRDLLI